MKKMSGIVILATAALIGIIPLANVAQAADGKNVFQTKCQMCHGAAGAGNEALARAFKLEPERLDLAKKSVQARSDAELATIVKSGKGNMPAFNDKLGDTDIKAVIQFIRSLAK